MKPLFQYLVYLLVRFLLLLIGWLPDRLLFALSNGLSSFLRTTIQYRKKVIQKNIDNSFPNLPSSDKTHLIKNYYHHLSDLLLETLQAFQLTKQALQARFNYQNTSILLPYLEKKQSIILMGSHFGNWEMGCLSFPLQVAVPVYTIYKPLSNPYIDQFLKNRRAQWGMNMVAMNKIGRVLVKNKEQPSVYIFVADQSPASVEQAIWKTFLHQDTPFINGVEKIAKRTNFPVFYFAIQKVKRGQYTVVFSPLTTSTVEGQLTESYVTQLTKQIATNPHQWLWSHNRWKRASRS